jgi:hypothetical protein
MSKLGGYRPIAVPLKVVRVAFKYCSLLHQRLHNPSDLVYRKIGVDGS